MQPVVHISVSFLTVLRSEKRCNMQHTNETHISLLNETITMSKRLTVESIRDTIRTEIDFPRDVDDWDYDLMLDFINATNLDTLAEIGDILVGNHTMTHDQKEQLVEIADRRADAILGGVE